MTGTLEKRVSRPSQTGVCCMGGRSQTPLQIEMLFVSFPKTPSWLICKKITFLPDENRTPTFQQLQLVFLQ